MATVFKRGGKDNRGGYWYMQWFDHNGQRQTKCSKTTDKSVAERIAAKHESDAALRRDGVINTAIERFGLEERRPITEHLAEFQTDLSAKQNTPKHVRTTVQHVKAILAETNGQFISDLTGAQVMSAIDAIRRAGNHRVKAADNRTPLSLRTCNAHLRSIKSFTRWLWHERRTPDDLLVGLKAFNEETDRRHERRALSVEEINYLLAFVETHTLDGHNLGGPDRAMLYRVALGTGFRAAELRSLKPGSFDFQSEPATVTAGAGYSKRRREDVQPLRADLAAMLRPWLAGKLPAVRPFAKMPGDTARMLRMDLQTARRAWIAAAKSDQDRHEREQSDFLTYRNAAGKVADFHATRHTFISNIVAGGASIKVAQDLARHSTCRLTVDRYAHTRLHDLQGALDSLPPLDTSNAESRELRATGTDDLPVNQPKRAQQQAQQLGRETVLFGAKSCLDDVVKMAEQNPPATSQVEPSCEVMRTDATADDRGAGGSRTHDGGFARRCRPSGGRGLISGELVAAPI